jgi:hypothetical protein
MTKTKSATKNVTINGPTKLRTMSMSSFFINSYTAFVLQTYIKHKPLRYWLSGLTFSYKARACILVEQALRNI